MLPVNFAAAIMQCKGMFAPRFTTRHVFLMVINNKKIKNDHCLPKDDVDKLWPGNKSWQLLCKFGQMFYGEEKVMQARYLKTQTASKHFHPEVKAMRYILNVSLMLQSFPNKACF